MSVATQSVSRPRRRVHGAAFKRKLVELSRVPGALVAGIAMAHGINANIVHFWRKLARKAGAVAVSEQFVPVSVAPPVPPTVDERSIEVELRRGGVTVSRSS